MSITDFFINDRILEQFFETLQTYLNWKPKIRENLILKFIQLYCLYFYCVVLKFCFVF
jgi:hypothetical protein